MNHAPVTITQHLELDMPWALDQLLHVNIRAAESLLRLSTRSLKGPRKFALLPDDAHTAAAAALRRFDDDRIADFTGKIARSFLVRHHSHASRNNRQARSCHGLARPVLLPH